jgi:murein DD-endopeptidase MepM/ murein hydrolase activator NlpD
MAAVSVVPEGESRMLAARKVIRRVALSAMLTAAALAALPSGTASANSYGDQQRQLQTLIQQKEAQLHRLTHRANDLFSQLQDTNAQLAATQGRLASLNMQLNDARANLAAIDAQLNVVAAALQQKSTQLTTLMGYLDSQQVAVNKRIADIYINAPTGYSQALSQSQDFADVVTANQFAGSVMRADASAMQKLMEAELLVAGQRVDIANHQTAIVKARNAQAAELAQIATIQAAQASVRSQQAALRQHQNHLLRLVNAQRYSYIKEIQDLQRQNALLSAIIRGAQRGQRVIQGVGGYLKWPVSGPITSPFGWRIHPIYGYRSFHTGIDIGVPMGTTVKAARYGKVIYTGWNGAFGLVVIIDHGNSLATMYAHLSRVFVSAGQRVSTLQAIAASGNTGTSTGPHLHFQVDLQGNPVNPLNWL